MAKRPVKAGSDSAGPDHAYAREPAGSGTPLPVHHQDVPRSVQASPRHRSTAAAQPGRRPQALQDPPQPRPRDPPERRPQDTADQSAGVRLLAWLPYLIVLAGVAAGIFVIWQGSKYASRGAGIIGASLLAGALFRLILPARYAGLLSSRRKASDVLTLAALGAAVLAVAISLP